MVLNRFHYLLFTASAEIPLSKPEEDQTIQNFDFADIHLHGGYPLIL